MSFVPIVLSLAAFIMAVQAIHKAKAAEKRVEALKGAEDERDQLRYVLAEVIGGDGTVVGRLEMPSPEPEVKALPPAPPEMKRVVSDFRRKLSKAKTKQGDIAGDLVRACEKHDQTYLDRFKGITEIRKRFVITKPKPIDPEKTVFPTGAAPSATTSCRADIAGDLVRACEKEIRKRFVITKPEKVDPSKGISPATTSCRADMVPGLDLPPNWVVPPRKAENTPARLRLIERINNAENCGGCYNRVPKTRNGKATGYSCLLFPLSGSSNLHAFMALSDKESHSCSHRIPL